LAADPWLAERLEARLAEIKIKLPAGAQSDALFDVLRTEVPERVRTLALAMIDRGQS
jgi:hypothetical protein